MSSYQYKAYGAACKMTAPQESPRAAAEQYFKQFPRSPRCDINEGQTDGRFFTVSYSADPALSTQKWRGVTRAQVSSLPDTARQIPTPERP